MTSTANPTPNTFPNLYSVIPGSKVIVLASKQGEGTVISSDNGSYPIGSAVTNATAQFVRDYGSYTLQG